MRFGTSCCEVRSVFGQKERARDYLSRPLWVSLMLGLELKAHGKLNLPFTEDRVACFVRNGKSRIGHSPADAFKAKRIADNGVTGRSNIRHVRAVKQSEGFRH